MEELLLSIANSIKDYRNGELSEPTVDHIKKWASQFSDDNRLIVLQETDHILKQFYLTHTNLIAFLRGLVKSSKLTGEDPLNFWGKVHFFSEQQNGNSQQHMVGELRSQIADMLSINPSTNAEHTDTYVYIDDFIFTGNRLFTDLREWIQTKAPNQCTVHIIVIGWYNYGQYSIEKRLTKLSQENNKRIKWTFWSHKDIRIENRLTYKNSSDVLWPTREVLGDSTISAYANDIECTGQKLNYRDDSNHSSKFFTSQHNRKILEKELLIAGLKIRSFSANPSRALKPLGFSPFDGFGFGAMVFTYRNCPNNCPLALWWGNPKAEKTHPFSKWYPLIERKTYENKVDFDIMAILDL